MECYSRPFKEFDSTNLSGGSESQVRLFGENNSGKVFSGNNRDQQRNQEKKIDDTKDKEEKKRRYVGDTFTRFSDNVMKMKKDGVEKAEHSWTGMKRDGVEKAEHSWTRRKRREGHKKVV